MVRVKRGKRAHKRRKKIIEQTKGYKWGRKSRYTLAKQALMKALSYSYRDRKTRKRVKRREWQIIINSACRLNNISYSKFIYGLKKANIDIDRKILAQLAQEHPKVFEKLIEISKEKVSS
ncbi:50S ribosomal protein L20 [bacterium HR34]|nr:50S ribosomal protein L20 [bacterium HR34]